MHQVTGGVATEMLVAGATAAKVPPRTAAASGDNQAVGAATDDAGARTQLVLAQPGPWPHRGEGFGQIRALRKDAAGVWRGTAQKGSGTVAVWLDYKGSVGAGSG